MNIYLEVTSTPRLRRTEERKAGPPESSGICKANSRAPRAKGAQLFGDKETAQG